MPVTVKKKEPPKPAKTVMKPVTAAISKINTDGSEESEHETVGEAQVPAQHVNVEFGCGLTRNMGNYESIKFHVGITIPCGADEIDDTFAQAKEWVDARVNEINQEISDSLES